MLNSALLAKSSQVPGTTPRLTHKSSSDEYKQLVAMLTSGTAEVEAKIREIVPH